MIGGLGRTGDEAVILVSFNVLFKK